MGKLSSKSDYVVGTDMGKYTIGKGYYTTHTDVSDLLQVGAFSNLTTPSNADVGKIIKRVEGKIDDKLKVSFRPEVMEKEVHNFESLLMNAYPLAPYKDYVGFIQLNSEKVTKILRLEAWQGDKYADMASASVTYTPPIEAQSGTYKLTFNVGGLVFELNEATNNGFYDQFGQKTTVLQICSAINEKYPSETSQFTGEVDAKTTASVSGGRNISDFFYACPSEDGKSVFVSSKLPSDAGTICTLVELLGSTSTTHTFVDNETGGRTQEFWTINEEGKIFFRTNYPYYQNHSIRVTYIRGSNRVPSSIHEATTKLVAAEVLLTDDNTILIAETGANIDLKTKHDILTKEAMEILEGKKHLVYLLD